MIAVSLNIKSAGIRMMSMMSLADADEKTTKKRDAKTHQAIVEMTVAAGTQAAF